MNEALQWVVAGPRTFFLQGPTKAHIEQRRQPVEHELREDTTQRKLSLPLPTYTRTIHTMLQPLAQRHSDPTQAEPAGGAESWAFSQLGNQNPGSRSFMKAQRCHISHHVCVES